MPVVKPARAFPLFSSVDDVNEVTSIHGAQCARNAAPSTRRRSGITARLMTIESDQECASGTHGAGGHVAGARILRDTHHCSGGMDPFVESHRWADPDRVERIFSVATDIAMTATRASKRRPLRASDCPFGQIADSPQASFSTIPETRRDRADLGRGVVNLDRSALTRLIVDHRDSRSGGAVELAEGWSGRKVARKRR